MLPVPTMHNVRELENANNAESGITKIDDNALDIGSPSPNAQA